MKYNHRPYQEKAIDNILEAWQRYNSTIFVSETGSGKTVIAGSVIHQLYQRKKKILFVVHRDNLLQQTKKAFREFGIRHGVIASGYPSLRYRTQIASMQTIIRRLDSWDDFDYMIIDESAHCPASTWDAVINKFKTAKKLGLTATPCRLDNRGLGNYFDNMIKGPSTKFLIDNGYLAEPLIYAPNILDLKKVRKIAGDYDRKELAKIANKNITGCAIEHYNKLCPGKPVVAFCCTIEHAEKTAERFRNAGYNSKALHSKLDIETIREYIEDLGKGKIHVLTSCDIISEGTDIPILAGVILLRPTNSLSLHRQQIGRSLRIYPGKKYAYILDHVGNSFRHGFPEDIIDWKLTKDIIQYEPLVQKKSCPMCFRAHKPRKYCPDCGYEYKTEGGKRLPKEVEGELQILNKEKIINEGNKSAGRRYYEWKLKRRGYHRKGA